MLKKSSFMLGISSAKLKKPSFMLGISSAELKKPCHVKPPITLQQNVSVSAMLVDTRQKKYRSSFYS